MIVRRGMMAGAALMLWACAVTMPPEYLGIATRMPVPPEDLARIEAAAAAAADARSHDGCPWPRAGGEGMVQVSCTLLPPSQLAGLAWSGDRPAALELGTRFEAGRGVPQDFARALSLYGTPRR